jgi:hypothetical protein
MRSPVSPSLPGLVEGLGPVPEGTPVTTLLIAETRPSTLIASANDVIARSFSAELAGSPAMSNIHADHLERMSEILSTDDGRIPARNRGTIEEIANRLQIARRTEAAARRTVRVLAGDKELANAVLDERRQLSRPMRRATALLCGIALGSGMGGIVYEAQSMPIRTVDNSGSQESQVNEPSQPGDVEYPLVGFFAAFGLGSGLALGVFAGESLLGPAARFRARRLTRANGQTTVGEIKEKAASFTQPPTRYYPPARNSLKNTLVSRAVKPPIKEPRPHNMHGSSDRRSHLGRNRGGGRRGKR